MLLMNLFLLLIAMDITAMFFSRPHKWSHRTHGIALGGALLWLSVSFAIPASGSDFSVIYAGKPPGALLEVPLRVFDVSASLDRGIPATGEVRIWNGGAASLSWSASSNQSWLSVSPASGTVTDENSEGAFTITCAPDSLVTGIYVGDVTITSGTQTKKVQVNFTVTGLSDAAPIITGCTDQTTSINTATAVLPFSVSDDKTPAESLVVTVDSANTSLVPLSNITLGGSGTSRTVMLTPATDQVGKTLITLIATDENWRSAILSFELTVQGSPLQHWRQEKFGTAANSGVAADTADAEQDGLPNLMEYALNMDPNASDREKLPAVSGTGSYLTLTYRKPDYVTGVSYTVQVSPDLAAWSDVNTATNTVGTGTDGDGTPTVTLRDDVPMAGNARRFMRLKVTAP